MRLRPPYLIFVGDVQKATLAKTGIGLVDWQPGLVVGQLRFGAEAIDLGVPDLSIEEAEEAGARSLVIGVAPVGGNLPEDWWGTIIKAANTGIDIVSGLHISLSDSTGLVAAAASSGVRLLDVRRPPKNIPVGTGIKRTGKRVLMVGTDCVSGKKYTALALAKTLHEAGIKATFRATGQTGIMLAGEGIAIDAVTADFISGAAELISPHNERDHWDVIEGQGSLFHPGYAGVSLGLLHGSQPDAFVVCHDAARTNVSHWEHFALPTIEETIEKNIELGQLTNPNIRCVGISANTSKLPPARRSDYLRLLGEQHGVPAVDPMIDGCSVLVERLKREFEE